MKIPTIFLFALLGMLAACTSPQDMNNEAEEAYAATVDSVREAIVGAWNNTDVELFKSVSTEDVTRNTNGAPDAKNQAEYVGLIQAFKNGFPDMKVEVNSTTTVYDELKSYNAWTVTGTNTGEFNGAPPTGNAISIQGFSVWHINADGKATREDVYFDNLSMMQQLGYTLAPPALEEDDAEEEGEE